MKLKQEISHLSFIFPKHFTFCVIWFCFVCFSVKSVSVLLCVAKCEDVFLPCFFKSLKKGLPLDCYIIQCIFMLCRTGWRLKAKIAS